MKLQTILFVFLCISFQPLLAQTGDSLVIAGTVDRGHYYYIPKSALTDSVHGICHQIMIDRKASRKTRPIEFNWNSACNDGYYILSITPAQIFFSSAHDNPNPNFLFWVIDIDNSQFEQISQGLRKSPPKGFTNVSKHYWKSQTVFKDNQFQDDYKYPTEWTDSTLQQHELYCAAQIKSQLDLYFSILNFYISNPAHKVSVPVVVSKPKYFGYSESEIRGWMPVKFVHPQVIEQ